MRSNCACVCADAYRRSGIGPATAFRPWQIMQCFSYSVDPRLIVAADAVTGSGAIGGAVWPYGWTRSDPVASSANVTMRPNPGFTGPWPGPLIIPDAPPQPTITVTYCT